MILNELNTAFRWYDDIEKQNRNKSYCTDNCDFSLLTPLNSLLPFQIRTQDIGEGDIEWKVFCSDGDELFLDLSSKTGLLSLVNLSGKTNIIYEGDDLESLLPCGNYYSTIEFNSVVYFSEVFRVTDIDDPDFLQMDFPLKTAWRYYDNQQKENRFKSYCQDNCNYYLVSGNDALIPFMFRTTESPLTLWVLRAIDGSCEVNIDTSLLDVQTVGDYDYIIYYGDLIDDLPCGVFESIVTVGGVEYYSEPILIIDTIQSYTDTNYILQENGFKILQENEFGILLE